MCRWRPLARLFQRSSSSRIRTKTLQSTCTPSRSPRSTTAHSWPQDNPSHKTTADICSSQEHSCTSHYCHRVATRWPPCSSQSCSKRSQASTNIITRWPKWWRTRSKRITIISRPRLSRLRPTNVAPTTPVAKPLAVQTPRGTHLPAAQLICTCHRLSISNRSSTRSALVVVRGR